MKEQGIEGGFKGCDRGQKGTGEKGPSRKVKKVRNGLNGVPSDLGDVVLGDSSAGLAEAGGDGSSSRS